MERRNFLKATASLPLLTLADRAPRQDLEGMSVVVVGMGAFGSWTAWQLTRQGAQVTMVDPWGPGNSRSSSGGESRVIRSVYGADRVYTHWVERSFSLWQQLEQETGQKVYQATGALWMFSAEDDYMRQSIPIASEYGFQVDELTHRQGSQRFPQIDLAGIKTLFFEHAAGSLAARKACAVLVERARQEGARKVAAAARPLQDVTGPLKQIELAGGDTLAADQFVFAGGPWLGQLLPGLLGERINPTRQEVHYFGYPSRPGPHPAQDLPIWIDFGQRLYYGIPGTARRGFKVADDTRGEAVDPTTMDRRPSDESIRRCRGMIARRFPALAKAPLVESRVCQYENSPDGHFIIDRHPAAENVWIVGGGSGHGFKLSPAIGQHVADRLAGRAGQEPFFSLGRWAGREEPEKTQFDQDK